MNVDTYLKALGITQYTLKSKISSASALEFPVHDNLNSDYIDSSINYPDNAEFIIQSTAVTPNISPKTKMNINNINSLDELDILINNCTKCNLCKTRKQAILGSYTDISLENSKLNTNINIDCLIVGEAPKDAEDELGMPFAGEVNELLAKMLNAIGLNNAYITNVIKCKSKAEKPNFEQLSHCEPYLFKQISILKPRTILALGKVAAQTLINPQVSLADIHGKVYGLYGTQIIATYHPRFVMSNPEYKRKVWGDLLSLKELLIK
ncbi:MAG: hypothetical protein RLZZ210_1800 [Pseudomonadota bacterium]|jgi:DNA polymerase